MRLRCTLLALGLLAGSVAHADPQRARNNYLLHCMGCHGETGHGLEGRVPSMHGTLASMSASAEGRSYVLRVPGVTQSTLGDAELAEVLNWAVLEFADDSSSAAVAPFTAQEIASARKQPLLDVFATRKRVLALED